MVVYLQCYAADQLVQNVAASAEWIILELLAIKVVSHVDIIGVQTMQSRRYTRRTNAWTWPTAVALREALTWRQKCSTFIHLNLSIVDSLLIKLIVSFGGTHSIMHSRWATQTTTHGGYRPNQKRSVNQFDVRLGLISDVNYGIFVACFVSTTFVRAWPYSCPAHKTKMAWLSIKAIATPTDDGIDQSKSGAMKCFQKSEFCFCPPKIQKQGWNNSYFQTSRSLGYFVIWRTWSNEWMRTSTAYCRLDGCE
jgi:hypothetical protein